MEFTQQDREALYNVWMSQKAKMRITQMEVAKKLGLTQLQFSNTLRGGLPLTMPFVSQFCRMLHVDPQLLLPSLMPNNSDKAKVVYLQNRISVDGEIQHVYIDGKDVVIEYAHTVS
ncbi:helix-turn-helix transcriptional regulator [Vibrio sp. SCSIO 43136]|uniref:helix-turn-helix domain-containing protein n=1 Tax=Vibrio sp. SCSIO 43136 TaxID=2819101 RepID=UPI002074B152|nr:helix-turn-helix transcriptional regulator [Vibrio sp. SCSIO 43136]USD67770.1 helix-turn-helix transcriptional regulator [Vibrio sp. SCSIO 43136]